MRVTFFFYPHTIRMSSSYTYSTCSEAYRTALQKCKDMSNVECLASIGIRPVTDADTSPPCEIIGNSDPFHADVKGGTRRVYGQIRGNGSTLQSDP